MTTTKNTNDWRATLPEEWTVRATGPDGTEQDIPLRDHPALARYETKDEAVKALVHAQKLLGKTPEGYIRLPGQDAQADQLDAFHAALGRPENPDGYALPELELPEGFEIREELIQGLKAKAHELGLTPGQVAGLYQWFLPLVMDAHHAMNDEAARLRDSELDTLRAVHRGETPRLLDNALRAAEAIGGDDLLDALTRTGAGDRAAVISAFAKIAPLVLESGLRGASPGWGEELTREKLREMMQDPRYHDPAKRDESYVARIRKGFDTLYPGNYIPGGQLQPRRPPNVRGEPLPPDQRRKSICPTHSMLTNTPDCATTTPQDSEIASELIRFLKIHLLAGCTKMFECKARKKGKAEAYSRYARVWPF